MSCGLYRGDVVIVQLGPETARGIVREIYRTRDLERAKVQIGDHWTWLFTEELTWNGECMVRLPRTDRGWRKLGRLVAAGVPEPSEVNKGGWTHV